MSKLTQEALWQKKQTLTAEGHLDLVLGAVKGKGLPLRYWRPNFFFFGMKDEQSLALSGGQFPAKLEPSKSHPVFSLAVLPGGTGVRVCPCSTKKPFHNRPYRYILPDCHLRHTGLPIGKKTILVEQITFLIPEETATRLRFHGEVPKQCIQTSPGRQNKGSEHG